MNRTWSWKLASYLIGTVLAAGCWAQSATSSVAELKESRSLAPGVVYKHLSRSSPAGEPWSIHIIEVSRAASGVAIRACPGMNPAPPTEMARELPTQIATRETIHGSGVVAVVNGDYDAMPYLGVSVGPSVTSRRLWTAGGKSEWPAFAISPGGRIAMGTPRFLAELRAGQGKIAIHSFNKVPNLNVGAALYSRGFRSSLKLEKPGRVVTLSQISPDLPLQLGADVSAIVRESVLGASEIAIPEDALVLVTDPNSSAGKLAAQLRPGQRVKLQLHLRVGKESDPEEVIGGFPIIVQNARREIVGKVAESHRKRHPRTAVCFNEREVIFSVVDGRQPGLSVGMTLEELGDLMVSLGCKEAMNTDGGGSSVMAIRDPGDLVQMHIVNSPSDGRERGRGNAWVIEQKTSALH